MESRIAPVLMNSVHIGYAINCQVRHGAGRLKQMKVQYQGRQVEGESVDFLTRKEDFNEYLRPAA